MSLSNVKEKSYKARLDYKFNWGDWLQDGETIITHTITSASGITSGSSFITSGCVVVWVDGGEIGVRYPLACLIGTSASRVDQRTMKIDVKDI